MSTLSVRTWFLMSIIPLSVLLQGCDDDDCTSGGSGSSGDHDPCPRDGSEVGAGKSCICSVTASTAMDDNICTKAATLAPGTPTAAPSPTGAPAPSAAPQGTFCWTDGQCHAAAEAEICMQHADLVAGVKTVGVGPCLCNGSLMDAGVYCESTLATPAAVAQKTTFTLSKPLWLDYDTSKLTLHVEGHADNSSITIVGPTDKAAAKNRVWAIADVLCGCENVGLTDTGTPVCPTAVAGACTCPHGNDTVIEFTRAGSSPYWTPSADMSSTAGSTIGYSAKACPPSTNANITNTSAIAFFAGR